MASNRLFVFDYFDDGSNEGALQIMSTHVSGSIEAKGEWPKTRLIGWFLLIGLPVILGIFVASRVVNRRLALEVEEGPDGSSVALLSPFGAFSLRKTQEGNQSLLLYVYPASIRQEQAWLDWPGGNATPRRQLALLTYRSTASLEQLDSWFREKLGTGFGRNKGWPVARGEETPTWMRRVENRPRPEAITFHQELPHRIKGVLLLPESEGQGSEIKLYDYMENPGQ